MNYINISINISKNKCRNIQGLKYYDDINYELKYNHKKRVTIWI